MAGERFWSDFHFRDSTLEPMYMQIAEYLRHRIQSGVLKPGDKLTAENEVVKLLNASRTTVRMAFDQLVDEGIVARYRGRGSFVVEQKLKRNINYLYNFTESIREIGAVPSSTVIRCDVIQAYAMERQKLNLSATDSKVFLIERLRLANGEPLILEKTSIPYYLCPGIERFDFSSASLYATLRGHYGLNICRAEETIEAIVLKKPICAQLNCASGVPGYAIERVSHLDSGYICEHTRSVTRADRCVFRLELQSNQRTREYGVDFERKMILGGDASGR